MSDADPALQDRSRIESEVFKGSMQPFSQLPLGSDGDCRSLQVRVLCNSWLIVWKCPSLPSIYISKSAGSSAYLGWNLQRQI